MLIAEFPHRAVARYLLASPQPMVFVPEVEVVSESWQMIGLKRWKRCAIQHLQISTEKAAGRN